MSWLEHDYLDIPDRTDRYLMQIAREIRRVLAGKDAAKIATRDFYLRGSTVLDAPPGNLTEDEKSKTQKAIEKANFESVWGARLKRWAGPRPPKKTK